MNKPAISGNLVASVPAVHSTYAPAPTTRDAVAAIERIADERLDLQRERIALRAEVQRLTAAYDSLADKHAALVVECDTLRAALGGGL